MRFPAVLALALAVPTMGACSAAPTPATSPPTANAVADDGPGAVSASIADDDPTAVQSDEQITSAISARLEGDSDSGLESVKVSTVEGVVTLTGNVSTPGARNVAIFLADDVTGVVSVVNDLVIVTDYDGAD